MKLLLEPPSPLTAWQLRAVWITAFLVALTRVYALAQSLWDWDEVQFSGAVREYNVASHHPHPPGFPLFILAANLVRPFAANDFRAIQTVAFLGAIALFPLAFFLARELRFPFLTAFTGALLFVFFANVWFYGGTGFSDIPGTAVAMAAVLLLLRGCRDPRAYFAGAVALAIAAGFRPQALLFGFAPFLVASWIQLRQSWRRVFAAGAIIAAIIAVSYLGAATASASYASYREQLHGVREWVRKVDSFLAPGRPPLALLADEFFLRPMGGNRLPIVTCTLAAIGLLSSIFVKPRASVWLAVATFLPFAIFAYLMLDLNSIRRYATSYVFLWAILAAHGAAALAMPLRLWRFHLSRLADAMQFVLVALVAGRAAYWTLPALREVRSTDSPSYAVMQWVRTHVPPGRRIWVHGSLGPWATYFLYDRDVRVVNDIAETQRAGAAANDLYVTEGLLNQRIVEFKRPHERTWEIARQRYFEASAGPISNVWLFGDGWWGEETDGYTVWQWMGKRGEATLPPIGGKARLTLSFVAAPRIAPVIDVHLNGVLVDRFRIAQATARRSWIVDARGDTPNQLTVTASETINLLEEGLSHDGRELSVQLNSYSWQPVR